MEMTASTETGVEGQGNEADDQLATQPNPADPTQTSTTAPTNQPSQNGSGTMQPRDNGAPSPQEKKPPKPLQG
jgi:hypothetical protein